MKNTRKSKHIVVKAEMVTTEAATPVAVRLEVLVAREAYGLEAEDWQHLTGTFTYGSGDTKAELDEIIARSCELWLAGRDGWPRYVTPRGP
jgi:NADPH:quinone reductase-like Zn-dependent oxidoreductase